MKFIHRLRRTFVLNNLNSNKILSLLGLCKKSGNLALGFDSCIESVNQKKSQIILITRDLSDNTKQKLFNQVDTNLIYSTELSMDEISNFLGKICGIISVNNKGFAKKIISFLNF